MRFTTTRQKEFSSEFAFVLPQLMLVSLMLVLMLMSMLMSHASDFFVLSFVLPCAYAYAYVASEDQALRPFHTTKLSLCQMFLDRVN